MESEDIEQKLKVGKILQESVEYFKTKWLEMALFSGANLLIALATLFVVESWQDPDIWPVLIVYYLFWSFFFRFYFEKKPYLQFKPLLNSLTPSVKILFLTAALLLILILLPFIPLFLGIPYFDNYINSLAYADDYTTFLQKYMQDSPLVDLGLNLLQILVMPLVLYRPFLAWISAIIGRRASLRQAWRKSRNNYGAFVLLALVMNVPLVILHHLGMISEVMKLLGLLVFAPLTVYFNVVMAKIYSFFYAE